MIPCTALQRPAADVTCWQLHADGRYGGMRWRLPAESLLGYFLDSQRLQILLLLLLLLLLVPILLMACPAAELLIYSATVIPAHRYL